MNVAEDKCQNLDEMCNNHLAKIIYTMSWIKLRSTNCGCKMLANAAGRL